MNEAKLQTLRDLYASGVRFSVPIELVDGHVRDVGASAESVIRYLADPEAFHAEFYDVSVPNYRDWRAAGGVARCGAQTQQGLDCALHISGAMGVDPKTWLQLDRAGYCHVHGGERVMSSTDRIRRASRAEYQGYLKV